MNGDAKAWQEGERLLDGQSDDFSRRPVSPNGRPQRSRSKLARATFALAVVSAVGWAVHWQRDAHEPALDFLYPRFNTRELPDQLRINGRKPAKQSFDDLGAARNPLLEDIKERISELSPQDGKLLRTLSRAAPRFPDTVGDQCGDIVARQAYNQQKVDTPKIVYYMTLKDLGLVDRSKGIISSFMLAYALDLPFHIYWDHTQVLEAETVFESPYINWAWPGPVDDQDPESSMFVSFVGWEGAHQENAYWKLHTRDALLEVAAPRRINYWKGNIGHVASAFKHPGSYFGRALSKRGLTMESVYGCGVSFLFQPLRATRLAMADYLAVLSHPAVFSVAIQARFGDVALLAGQTDAVMDPLFPLHYFECALAAAQYLFEPGQHKMVVIYVASDHPAMRTLILEHQDRLHAALEWDDTLPKPHFLLGPSLPRHVSVGSKLNSTRAEDRPIMQHDMQYSIFEHYLMDAADAHIITSNSGYGTLSALRRWQFGASNSTWQVDRPSGAGNNAPKLSHGELCQDDNSGLDGILFQWGFRALLSHDLRSASHAAQTERRISGVARQGAEVLLSDHVVRGDCIAMSSFIARHRRADRNESWQRYSTYERWTIAFCLLFRYMHAL